MMKLSKKKKDLSWTVWDSVELTSVLVPRTVNLSRKAYYPCRGGTYVPPRHGYYRA